MKIGFSLRRIMSALAWICLPLLWDGSQAHAASSALETAAPTTTTSLILTVMTHAGGFGVFIWLCLILCACALGFVLALACIMLRKKKAAPPVLVESVRNSLEQGDLLKAIQQCEKNSTPIARILREGFVHVEEGFEVIQDAAHVMCGVEEERLLRHVARLRSIAIFAPMLGLIGAMQGLIFSFSAFSKTTADALQQTLLAAHVSYSLWPVTLGLIIAVPAGIGSFFFKNRAARITLHLRTLTLDLIKTLRDVEVVQE